ncbi:MAG: 5'-methylthioadenosine/adenosylhomocysteine nucleosidase [Spirochaetota bacterium]
MIALVSALDLELKAFLKNIKTVRKEKWSDFTFHTGSVAGKEVVIAKVGVGKALAALVTQKIIDRYNPDAIILSGMAGGLKAGLEIGDIVVGEESLQYDLDVTRLGFKRGQIPDTRFHIMPSDPYLVSIAKKYRSSGGKLIFGRILTGDQYITGAGKEVLKFLTEELGGAAVDMEGASVGLTALVNKLPFLLVRIVSDKADGNPPPHFRKFAVEVSQKAYELVFFIISEMSAIPN